MSKYEFKGNVNNVIDTIDLSGVRELNIDKSTHNDNRNYGNINK